MPAPDNSYDPAQTCLTWFLQKYPYTGNAIVGGEYLVYLRAKGLINNWNPNCRVPATKDTTLTDLLTDPNSIHGISAHDAVPYLMNNNPGPNYSLALINSQFVKNLAEYFTSSGFITGHAVPYSFTDIKSGTCLTARVNIYSKGSGSLQFEMRWDLEEIFGQNDLSIGDAVNKAFESQRDLFKRLPQLQPIPEPKQLNE